MRMPCIVICGFSGCTVFFSTLCHKRYNFRNKYYVFWVCVCSLMYPPCNAHALYCHLWLLRLYSIFFPHYLIDGTIFAISITFSECVSVALYTPPCNAHALYCHLWLLPLYSIFFPHYLINDTIFEKKKVTEHKMCVLILSTSFVLKISHSKKN